MDLDEQIDYQEHEYWDNWCPACDHSPCAGKGDKGSCLTGRQHRRVHAWHISPAPSDGTYTGCFWASVNGKALPEDYRSGYLLVHGTGGSRYAHRSPKYLGMPYPL